MFLRKLFWRLKLNKRNIKETTFSFHQNLNPDLLPSACVCVCACPRPSTYPLFLATFIYILKVWKPCDLSCHSITSHSISKLNRMSSLSEIPQCALSICGTQSVHWDKEGWTRSWSHLAPQRSLQISTWSLSTMILHLLVLLLSLGTICFADIF